MKQYIGISRDHSASMRSLAHGAQQDYNENVDAIRAAAEKSAIDTVVSTVKCGVGHTGAVEREAVNSSLAAVKPIAFYTADGNSTPLFDSVGELIGLLEAVPDATSEDVSFLVMAITDGEENASKRFTAESLGAKIRSLQATDRWTFVFRVPRGYGKALQRLGIPAGNIQEWEQSERGLRESSLHTMDAVSTYYTGRTAGIRATDSFYTNPSNLDPTTIRNVLHDISSRVDLWPVKKTCQIRDFVEYKSLKPFRLGTAFYELTKPEKVVTSDKRICIRDKKTGAVHSGAQARDLLGLPKSGTIRLTPGDHGDYEIFVQSKSVNRKLMPGSKVLFWEGAQ